MNTILLYSLLALTMAMCSVISYGNMVANKEAGNKKLYITCAICFYFCMSMMVFDVILLIKEVLK